MNPAELYRKPSPPRFGHDMLQYFGFDPEYVNLNHGSYGSLPLPVISATNAMTLEAESSPDLFIRLTYQPRLVSVRGKIANFIGAHIDECVIVPNASHGLNTVLRNFQWTQGDVIIYFNTTYGSISRTVQYLSDIPPHPTTSQFTIQVPTTHSEIVSRFRQHVQSIPKVQGKKIVAVIDSIVSVPGVLMPWKEMVKICKEEGVWSVVDGAHSIGQEPNINMKEADPDFWVSNCHKWLYAKRGCAVLYVPLRNQHIIKTTFPTAAAYISPSERTSPNFVDQFEWTGTVDLVPYLSISAALDFRKWIGGETRINDYCHDMAMKGGKRLAEVLGTRVLDTTGEMTCNMVNVKIPLPPHVKPSVAITRKFNTKLLQDHKISSGTFYIPESGWWARCSAQVWSEVGDFEKLGKAMLSVCKEIEGETALAAKL